MTNGRIGSVISKINWESVEDLCINRRNYLDFSVCSQLLQLCAHRKSLQEAKRAHAQILKSGFLKRDNAFASNILLNTYAKCSDMEAARQVFDKMQEKYTSSWNSLISGYVQNGRDESSLEIFKHMRSVGIENSEFAFASVLRACANLSDVRRGTEIHALLVKSGFELDVILGSIIVDMYAKCQRMDDAHKQFVMIPSPDVVSWTTIIAGYAQACEAQKAMSMYSEMSLKGIMPNNFTLTCLVGACAATGLLKEGTQFHAVLVKSGYLDSVFAGNALIDMYSKCKCIDDARQVFDEMHSRDDVSWTSLVVGYSQNSLVTEAFRLFYSMKQQGMNADQFTYTALLNSCAGISDDEQGKMVHCCVLKTGLQGCIPVENALVDMYGKCGDIEAADNVFEDIGEKDVVSWTSIITGYAQNGYADKALDYFEKMLQTGFKPNHVTFLGVLFACSNNGFVDLGVKYFNSMREDHCIEPRMEHYVCMVDLFGRVGMLKRAENFIREMPVEPSSLVWQTLLGACKIHGDTQLGMHAAERILELEPNDSAAYALLSNSFSMAGRWDDAAKLSLAMKEKGLRNEPAQSWILVKNQVHSFAHEGRSHPQ